MNQAINKLFHNAARALHHDLHLARGISHPANKAQLMSKSVNMGPKPHALHMPRHMQGDTEGFITRWRAACRVRSHGSFRPKGRLRALPIGVSNAA